jgi:hypothetical protein
MPAIFSAMLAVRYFCLKHDACEGIPFFSETLMFIIAVSKRPPLYLMLSQFHPIRSFKHCFQKLPDINKLIHILLSPKYSFPF